MYHSLMYRYEMYRLVTYRFGMYPCVTPSKKYQQEKRPIPLGTGKNTPSFYIPRKKTPCPIRLGINFLSSLYPRKNLEKYLSYIKNKTPCYLGARGKNSLFFCPQGKILVLLQYIQNCTSSDIHIPLASTPSPRKNLTFH